MMSPHRLLAAIYSLAHFGTLFGRSVDAFAFDPSSSSERRILFRQHRRRVPNGGRASRRGTAATALDATSPEGHPAPSRPVRFLGKGPNAVVRPGAVLVAPAREASNLLMKSAVFVQAVGEDDGGTTLVRGVVIDHPTAFTMGEMAPGTVYGSLAGNILFRGGDAGSDTAMLLHSRGGDAVECGDMIGASGVYEGGLRSALDAAEEGVVDPEEFKFFFNFVEFTERELEQMLDEVDGDGDAWMSVEVPKEMVLDGDFNRGEAWKYIRNQITQMGIE